ncbi:MAG TPA: hypothetical protein VEQ41_00435 [Solirubrobacterales bacterium]|nr:hypothetical protein [Solirubrobacterales bacterium]
MKRIRKHLTYANVISTLALLLAISGATAYAGGKIKTRQIKPGAIKTKLLAPRAVKSGKIAPTAVRPRHIAPQAVRYRHIAPDSVGTEQLLHNSVSSAQLQPDSIDGSKVRNGSLTPADVSGGAAVVTIAQGGGQAVTSSSSTNPTPIPLADGSWTQGPTESNLFLAHVQATLESPPSGTCLVSIPVSVNGTQIDLVSLQTREESPTTVTREVLVEGARVATGGPRPGALAAAANQALPCDTAVVDSVRIVVLGVG